MTDLSAGSVSMPVRPDTTGFGAKMSQGIQAEAGRSAGGIGKVGKVLGGSLLAGAGIALGGLAAIIKTGIGEASDASAGTAQLAAGIKSTGNAAHVSVDGLNSLASSIQGYSGQTDDSIVKSEQLLLTFTNIKNSGPDKIFDLATKASADMAAKMGGDASGSAILLGKALNDPVKGITALTKVGVSFSKGQKDAIAAMVKTGNTAGAQKVILKELNTEFGGAAKAAGQSLPGQLARGKRAFEDLSQSVVETLVPIVVPAITAVSQGLIKAAPYAQKFAEIFAGDLKRAIAAIAPIIQATTKFLSEHMTMLKVVAGVIAGIMIPGFIKMGVEAVVSAVKQGAAWVATQAKAVAGAVANSIAAVSIVAGWVLMGAQSLIQAARMAAAWLIAMGPVGIVIAIVVGLVVLIIANWQRVSSATVAVWNAVKSAILAAINWVVDFVKSHWQLLIAIVLGPLGVIVGLVITHWGDIKSAVSAAINWVSGVISKVMGSISSAWSRTWGGLTTAVSTTFGSIKGVVRGIVNAVIDSINFMIRVLDGVQIKVPKIHIPGTNSNIGGGTVGFNIPQIPNLANGGIVLPEPGGKLVRVAEAGKAEAVVPLDSAQGRSMFGQPRERGKLFDTLNINQVDDPVGTSHYVQRRLAALAV